MARRSDRFRLRFLAERIALDAPLAIVDVGANPFGSAPDYDLLLKEGLAALWGFEPNADAYAALAEAAQPGRTYLPVAVGAPGRRTFHSHAISQLSSLFRVRPEAAKYLAKPHWIRREVTEIPVDLVALDALDDLPQIDLLKIDAQGAELEVIAGGAGKLKDAVAVIPEVAFYQMYEDQPMFGDVDAELRRQGFVLHKILFQKRALLKSSQAGGLHKRLGASQSIDGDAVYIRSLEDVDAVTTDQLKKLALLSDAVFRSHDLCLMCIDELVRRKAAPGKLPRGYFQRLPDDVKAPVAPAEAAE